jgi:hypothetical protein
MNQIMNMKARGKEKLSKQNLLASGYPPPKVVALRPLRGFATADFQDSRRQCFAIYQPVGIATGT